MVENHLVSDELAQTLVSYDKDKWFENEVSEAGLKDIRLQKRFRVLLEKLWNNFGHTIPTACQDWANTKAAYRFLSNDEVTEEQILTGHFLATKERANSQQEGWILVLQDTTEFSYNRANYEDIGATTILQVGKDLFGNPIYHKTHGILMHSSLVVTAEGIPLGLAAIKFWTRKKFKGTNALKRHINPTRIPIETKESYRWLENLKQSTELLQIPSRCIHIGDRESDIYELFCLAKELDTHFLVRTCVDRLIEDGKCTIADKMNLIEFQGLHTIEVQDVNGNKTEVKLEIKYQQVDVLPPIGKKKKYPGLTLTLIYAQEKEEPVNRDKIEWKLITDLPVTSVEQAIEKLDQYALRWRIESFHKILKSGCKAESIKLRTAQRLTNLIAIFCILSWRIFWMTIINRCSPNSPPELALTKEEISIIDQLAKGQSNDKLASKNLSYYLIKIAQLGGYLGRKSDFPPGNIVIWRGMKRLADITIGVNLFMKVP